MTTTLRLVLLALLALAASSSSCDCGGPLEKCTDNAQCDATGQGFNECRLSDGVCICIDDRACGPQEFCNALGRCQTIAGCGSNDDCENENLFCDTTSSQCLSVQECSPEPGQSCCTLDSQCPFRQICDTLALSCVPGCRENGDCVLGEGCVGAGFGRLGQCGRECTDDNLCNSGELCNLTTGVCELDTRGPYCQGCSGGVASDDCGAFGNYCLTDSVNGGEFCGVECAQGQACPQDYSCSRVIIIPPAAPFCSFPEDCVVPKGGGTGICSRTGVACNQPEECPEGPPDGDCAARTGGRTGSCVLNPSLNCDSDADCEAASAGECIKIECRGGEGDTFGHCTCTRDSDCPTDRCLDAVSGPNPQVGHCELSGHDCLEDFECDVITCVEGGCLIGSNCAPANDATCATILQQQNP